MFGGLDLSLRNREIHALSRLFDGGNRAGVLYEPWRADSLTLSGSNITTIADQIGSNDATQTTDANRPVSSGDWMDFDGVDDWLEFDLSSGQRTTDMALFALVHNTGTDNSFTIVGSRGNSTHTIGFAAGNTNPPITNAGASATAWVNNTQVTTRQELHDAIGSTPVIFEARTLDLTAVEWGAVALAIGDTATPPAWLAFNGALGTVLLIDNPTADERDSIRHSLANRYGVTL